MKIRKQ